MGVFEKHFEKDFRFAPKKLYLGVGWQADVYTFRGEGGRTLFVKSALFIDLQRLTSPPDLSPPPPGAPVRGANITVTYLCEAPGVSRLHYTVTAVLAKPTTENGSDTFQSNIAREDSLLLLAFSLPDFGGAHTLIRGAFADPSELGSNFPSIASFVVVSGTWAFFRAPSFQRGYALDPTTPRNPRNFEVGRYPSLASAGVADGIQSACTIRS